MKKIEDKDLILINGAGDLVIDVNKTPPPPPPERPGDQPGPDEDHEHGGGIEDLQM